MYLLTALDAPLLVMDSDGEQAASQRDLLPALRDAFVRGLAGHRFTEQSCLV